MQRDGEDVFSSIGKGVAAFQWALFAGLHPAQSMGVTLCPYSNCCSVAGGLSFRCLILESTRIWYSPPLLTKVPAIVLCNFLFQVGDHFWATFPLRILKSPWESGNISQLSLCCMGTGWGLWLVRFLFSLPLPMATVWAVSCQTWNKPSK